MFKIEMLYPDTANLYGDHYNIEFLRKSLPECQIIRTGFGEKPHFVDNKVNLLYMGPSPEKFQEHALDELKQYRDDVQKRIDDGEVSLFTGNAFEILGDYIEKGDGSRIECLGIYHGYARREMFNRYNSLYLGTVEGLEEGRDPIKILGFKTQFSKSYDMDPKKHAFATLRELDLDNTREGEGIRLNNFFGTYVLGPILVNNPIFAVYLLELAGAGKVNLAFGDYALECYSDRLKEFENPNVMMN